MTNQLKVEPCLLLALSDSVAHAQAMLQQANNDFAVIADADQPQALMQRSDVTQLTSAEHRQLAEVVSQLPPPVVIEERVVTPNNEKLREILLLLKQTNAPGLIVYQNKQILGVIPLNTLIDALPPSAIRRLPRRGLYGDSVIPARAYICHTCEKDDPPAPFALPREGDTPTCPKHWRHGLMEPVKSEAM